MTWVYEEAMSWILTLLGDILSLLSSNFMSAFTMDTSMFTAYIPYFDNIVDIIGSLGIAIAFLILICCLVRNLLAPILEMYEQPVVLCMRFIVAMFASVFAKDLIGYEWMFFKGFYSQLSKASLFSSKADMAQEVTEEVSFNSSSIVEALNTGLGIGVSAVIIVSIILLIAIIINYTKLLLEAAERYIVINLLIVFSPLAGSAITSKNTHKIFGSYMRMMFSQLLLLCMNVIFIRGTISMLASVGSDLAYTDENDVVQGSLLIFMLFCLAFMKAGLHVDSYMRSLGLDVVQTGGSLLYDALGGLAVARGLGQTISNAAHGRGVAGAFSNLMGGNSGDRRNGMIGAANDADNLVNKLNNMSMGENGRFNPTPQMSNSFANAIKNGLHGDIMNSMDGLNPQSKAQFLDAATGGALGARIAGGIGNVVSAEYAGKNGIAFKTSNGGSGFISGKNGIKENSVPIGNGLFITPTGKVPLGNTLSKGVATSMGQFIGGNAMSQGARALATALGINPDNATAMKNLMAGSITGMKNGGGIVKGADGKVLGAVQFGSHAGAKGFKANHGLDSYSAMPISASGIYGQGAKMDTTVGSIISPNTSNGHFSINGKEYSSNGLFKDAVGDNANIASASVGLVSGVDSETGLGIHTGDGQTFGISNGMLEANEIIPEQSMFDNDMTLANINNALHEGGYIGDATTADLANGNIHAETYQPYNEENLGSMINDGFLRENPDSATGYDVNVGNGIWEEASPELLSKTVGLDGPEQSKFVFDAGDGQGAFDIPSDAFVLNNDAKTNGTNYADSLTGGAFDDFANSFGNKMLTENDCNLVSDALAAQNELANFNCVNDSIPDQSVFDVSSTLGNINDYLMDQNHDDLVFANDLANGNIHAETYQPYNEKNLGSMINDGFLRENPDSVTGYDVNVGNGIWEEASPELMSEQVGFDTERSRIVFDAGNGNGSIEIPSDAFVFNDDVDTNGSQYADSYVGSAYDTFTEPLDSNTGFGEYGDQAITSALDAQPELAEFNSTHPTVAGDNVESGCATTVVSDAMTSTFEKAVEIGSITGDGQNIFALQEDYSNLDHGYADIKTSDEKDYRFYDAAKYDIEGIDESKLETLDVDGHKFIKVEGTVTNEGFKPKLKGNRGEIKIRKSKDGFGGFEAKE